MVNNEEGLFFCIEDLVAITDIGDDEIPGIADKRDESEGR